MDRLNLNEDTRKKIYRWADKFLFCEKPTAGEKGWLELTLGSTEDAEAFLSIDGVDYYVLGNKENGVTKIQITILRTLDDLPAITPDEVPANIYDRLQQNTKEKKGWIRRSQA